MFNRYAHIKKNIFGDYYKYCKKYSSLMDLCIFQCSLYLVRGLIFSPIVYVYSLDYMFSKNILPKT